MTVAQASAERQGFETVAGSQIHVTRWGDEGPRVILVHGSAQGSSAGGDRHFVAQRTLAAQGWQLIVPDRPGHGRSLAPGRPDDAEADAVWVGELLGEGAHLIGHSFGGCVALAAAARRPEAVRSLTLIEPGMQKLATDEPEVRALGLKMMRAILFSFSPQRRARRFFELLGIPPEVRGRSDDAEMRRIGRSIAKLKVPSAAILRRQLEVVKAADVPLLVVNGGWSRAFDATGIRVAEVGGGTHRIIASPHHFPNLVTNGFNELVADFMTQSKRR